MPKYTFRLDFGANPYRSLIVNIGNGKEIAGNVFSYPSGESGVIADISNPNLARKISVLGGAIFGVVVAAGYDNVESAQTRMTGINNTYKPIAEKHSSI